MTLDVYGEDGTSIAQTLYYQQNARGDVVALTDSARQAVLRLEYSAYGIAYQVDENGELEEFSDFSAVVYAFQGRRFDVETGNLYFRNRYYDPVRGRWLTRDPIKSDLYLYEAFYDSPYRFGDPMGLQRRGFSLDKKASARLKSGDSFFDFLRKAFGDKKNTASEDPFRDIIYRRDIVEENESHSLIPIDNGFGLSDHSGDFHYFMPTSAEAEVMLPFSTMNYYTAVFAENYAYFMLFGAAEGAGIRQIVCSKQKFVADIGENIRLFHGTSSSRASKIVGNQFKPIRGFRGLTFFAEEPATAEYFAFESIAKYSGGQQLPKSLSIIEFRIPKMLANELRLLKRKPIGAIEGTRFVDIPYGTGYERVLPYPLKFNEALKQKIITAQRIRIK